MPRKTKAGRTKYAQTRRQQLRAKLHAAKRKPCADCEHEYKPYVMDFDHRPNEKKSFVISTAASQGSYGWERIQQEIDKCDVVCANCHRERTYGDERGR